MYWVYLQIWGGGGLQKAKTWQRGGRGKGGQVPAVRAWWIRGTGEMALETGVVSILSVRANLER